MSDGEQSKLSENEIKAHKTQAKEHDHAHCKHHHSHGHGLFGHNHAHHGGLDKNSESQNIALAFWLNFSFAIIEFIGGIFTNSVAIIADAIHDLGDSLAIGFAWVASKIAKKEADEKYSYGYRRFSLLSALITGLILVFGSIWVLSEAIPRLLEPQLPHTGGMFVLALFGVAVNGAAVLRLRGGKTQNEKVLSWHLLEDVLGWVAVLVGAVIMYFSGWAWIDPVLSIGFTLFILYNVVKGLNKTLALFLQVTPDAALLKRINEDVNALDFVKSVHHIHLWSLDGDQHVLTMHLQLKHDADFTAQLAYKKQVAELLKPHNIRHTTVEFELADETCRDNL